MTDVLFPAHTLESAPPAARRAMQATAAHLGYLPAGVAQLASSPQLLDGFLKVSALFDTTSLEPVAREVVVMTIAVRNGCHICVAMHSARLVRIGADDELIGALRDGKPLADARLAAVQTFTLDVIATSGAVSDEQLQAFLGHGYTAQNALEVVFGVGTYTMSSLANRLVRAPLDDQLSQVAWEQG